MDKLNQILKMRFERFLNSNIALYIQILIVISCAVFFLWDIHLYLSDQKVTIIKIVKDDVEGKLFVITWMWGILSSHLFVGRRIVKSTRKIPEFQAIVILILLSIIIYLLGGFIPNGVPQHMQLIFLLFGGMVGYFLWPQALSKAERADQ